MVQSRLTLRLATAVALLTVAGAATADAQSDPRLVSVVQLAQDGMIDSAQAVVRKLLADVSPSDTTYAEILYTSGIVARTQYDRRIALRRVIVEYSSSSWADDALLQIGQDEYANGNPGAAMAQFARLLSDYPSSSLTPVAAFWGARAAADIRNGAEACRLADLGLAARIEDVELKNQIEFQKQRCTAILSQVPDTAQSAPVTPAPAPVADTNAPKPKPVVTKPTQPGFRVQVIAAPTQAKADERVAALKRISYEAVIVKEGGFFKVRAGPYATRAEANAAMAKIKARLGGQPFVVADR